MAYGHRDWEDRFTRGKYKGVPRCQQSIADGGRMVTFHQCDKVARPEDEVNGDRACSFHMKAEARREARGKKFEDDWNRHEQLEKLAKDTAHDLGNRLAGMAATVRPFYIDGLGNNMGVYDPTHMIVDTDFLETAARALEEKDWA